MLVTFHSGSGAESFALLTRYTMHIPHLLLLSQACPIANGEYSYQPTMTLAFHGPAKSIQRELLPHLSKESCRTSAEVLLWLFDRLHKFRRESKRKEVGLLA